MIDTATRRAVDLDEMEAALGYRDDWNRLIQELRAARGVLGLLKSLLSEDGVREAFLSYNVGAQIIDILEANK